VVDCAGPAQMGFTLHRRCFWGWEMERTKVTVPKPVGSASHWEPRRENLEEWIPCGTAGTHGRPSATYRGVKSMRANLSSPPVERGYRLISVSIAILVATAAWWVRRRRAVGRIAAAEARMEPRPVVY
jgi:hypothetical protein